MQLYFDVILILVMSSVISLWEDQQYYTSKCCTIQSCTITRTKLKNTTAFIPVSVGLHKYTKLLFFGIHFFRRKAVGFLKSETFKYYAFVKRSESPLYILLTYQNFVSLTWKGYLELFREQWLTAKSNTEKFMSEFVNGEVLKLKVCWLQNLFMW